MEKCKRDKKMAERIKTGIAAEFDLPDAEHVNIEKYYEYLNFLNTDEARLDRFLDSLEQERSDYEQRGAVKVRKHFTAMTLKQVMR